VVDLSNFSIHDMTRCCATLRGLGAGASSMQEVAERTTRYLYDELGDPRTKSTAIVLARFFKTHAFGNLDRVRQKAARALVKGHTLSPKTPCVTLLASTGSEPDWNDALRSTAHLTIPIVGTDFASRFPMMENLLLRLGYERKSNGRAPQAVPRKSSYDVFHVDDARKSPFIPAQADFIERYGVRSVIGFGGTLLGSDIFAVLLFTKVSVNKRTCELFKTLTLGVKIAALPYADQDTFAAHPGLTRKGRAAYRPEATP